MLALNTILALSVVKKMKWNSICKSSFAVKEVEGEQQLHNPGQHACNVISGIEKPEYLRFRREYRH